MYPIQKPAVEWSHEVFSHAASVHRVDRGAAHQVQPGATGDRPPGTAPAS